ncbi:MAG: hypothetical protein V1806_08090 [Pseudomonadota bacterium]
MSDSENTQQFENFLRQWPASLAGLQKVYIQLKTWAEALPAARSTFVARPGVSHSLRFDLAPRPAGRQRPVFALVDVVDMSGELFLSVCFYEDEINDPQEMGNAIPQGLFQETGYCFDLEDDDPESVAYLAARLNEAHAAALASAKG